MVRKVVVLAGLQYNPGRHDAAALAEKSGRWGWELKKFNIKLRMSLGKQKLANIKRTCLGAIRSLLWLRLRTTIRNSCGGDD